MRDVLSCYHLAELVQVLRQLRQARTTRSRHLVEGASACAHIGISGGFHRLGADASHIDCARHEAHAGKVMECIRNFLTLCSALTVGLRLVFAENKHFSFDLVQRVVLTSESRVAFIGSGPMPLTSLVLARRHMPVRALPEFV